MYRLDRERPLGRGAHGASTDAAPPALAPFLARHRRPALALDTAPLRCTTSPACPAAAKSTARTSTILWKHPLRENDAEIHSQHTQQRVASFTQESRLCDSDLRVFLPHRFVSSARRLAAPPRRRSLGIRTVSKVCMFCVRVWSHHRFCKQSVRRARVRFPHLCAWRFRAAARSAHRCFSTAHPQQHVQYGSDNAR